MCLYIHTFARRIVKTYFLWFPRERMEKIVRALLFFFPPPSVESHASLTDFFVMITSAETFHYTDWMESFPSSKFHRFF